MIASCFISKLTYCCNAAQKYFRQGLPGLEPAYMCIRISLKQKSGCGKL